MPFENGDLIDCTDMYDTLSNEAAEALSAWDLADSEYHRGYAAAILWVRDKLLDLVPPAGASPSRPRGHAADSFMSPQS